VSGGIKSNSTKMVASKGISFKWYEESRYQTLRQRKEKKEKNKDDDIVLNEKMRQRRLDETYDVI
jgi:hypothetical protein